MGEDRCCRRRRLHLLWLLLWGSVFVLVLPSRRWGLAAASSPSLSRLPGGDGGTQRDPLRGACERKALSTPSAVLAGSTQAASLLPCRHEFLRWTFLPAPVCRHMLPPSTCTAGKVQPTRQASARDPNQANTTCLDQNKIPSPFFGIATSPPAAESACRRTPRHAEKYLSRPPQRSPPALGETFPVGALARRHRPSGGRHPPPCSDLLHA